MLAFEDGAFVGENFALDYLKGDRTLDSFSGEFGSGFRVFNMLNTLDWNFN